ncbi:unnamed protein product [Dimorphilus gyrociliatus]|uniref:RING-type domain-containing protein n=1 Tax=Dimorphilus gyrociliatus TaxID=2664684 RepID=A0A7I8VF77_9ANNE|nr:unnamed protein product [Dimorphilus gyrociliatus]
MESNTQLLCGICTQSMDKRQPRILPCQHNFCLQCLDQLDTDQSNNEICCPVCKNKVRLSAKGIYGLPRRSSTINSEKSTNKSACSIHNTTHISPTIICSVCKSDILCLNCLDKHKPPKCRIVFSSHYKMETKKAIEAYSLKLDIYERRIEEEVELLRQRLKETEDDCYKRIEEKVGHLNDEIEEYNSRKINEIKKLRREIQSNHIDEKEMEKKSDNFIKGFSTKQSFLALNFDLAKKPESGDDRKIKRCQPTLETIHKFRKIASISAEYNHCKYLNDGLVQIVYSKNSCSLIRIFKNGQRKQTFISKLITDFSITVNDTIYAIDEGNKRILKSNLKNSMNIKYNSICQVDNAWRLFVRDDAKVSIAVLSSPQKKNQTVSLIFHDKLEWTTQSWGEANLTLTACVLSDGNVIGVGNNCLVMYTKKSGSVVRILPWSTSPFEVYSVIHLPREGFLLTKNGQSQIQAFDNELVKQNNLKLNFSPGEIQLTSNGTLYTKNITNLSVVVHEII